jgi:DNA invertase Pin-like site-specific DNA recombinase
LSCQEQDKSAFCQGGRFVHQSSNGRTLFVMPKTVQQLAIGYCRVSTDQQGERGYGLGAQRLGIEAEAVHRNWSLGRLYVDVASGKSMRKRDELALALTALDAGEAQILIVAKLDRLSRSLLDFAGLMARSQAGGWSIVALDIGVDTSTVNGELIANIIMALAQWERRVIGNRTRDALAVVKEQGGRLGRPSGVSDDTTNLIVVLRQEGRSYREIASVLNARAVPTAQAGREWYASTVRSVEKGAQT